MSYTYSEGVQRESTNLPGRTCNQTSVTSSITWRCNILTDASSELPTTKEKKDSIVPIS
jgi:hypothetical protein